MDQPAIYQVGALVLFWIESPDQHHRWLRHGIVRCSPRRDEMLARSWDDHGPWLYSVVDVATGERRAVYEAELVPAIGGVPA